MVKNINVETVLKYLGQGVSQPALVMCDDYIRYILKTQRVLEDGKLIIHDCMFLNELLAFQIADYLSVPIPEAAIAHLDRRLVDEDPFILFAHRFHPGIHFASQELMDKEDNLVENYSDLIKMGKPYMVRTWNAFFEDIINPQDIAKIVAYDLLIANFDRFGNNGNLLIALTDEGRKVFSIDHGHAFCGPVWNTAKMNFLKAPTESLAYIDSFVDTILTLNFNIGYVDGFGEVFRAIEPNIDLSEITCHSFQAVVEMIEQITETDIDSWFKSIPDPWFVDKSLQISFYKHFLLKQKNLIRWFIQRMAERRAFSKYRGGDLKWVTSKQFGTA